MTLHTLVTGITGNIGFFTAQKLLEEGFNIRGAVTDPERARRSLDDRVKLVKFDFLDPSTYAKALSGVDRLFLMRPPVLNKPRDLYPFIDAAVTAGVRHVVFISLLGIEHNPFPPHYKIEKYIKQSGIPFTFLRPSFFMQNLNTTHREDIRDRDDIFLPAGHAKVSFIDTRDIGEAAARVLMEPELHANKSYTLTGPEAVTYSEAACLFTEILGRSITYSNPSVGSFKKELLSRGIPKDFVNVMAVLYLTTRFGMANKVTNELEALLGRLPRTLAQYVHDYADEWM